MPATTKSKKPARSSRSKSAGRSSTARSGGGAGGISSPDTITNYTTAVKWLLEHHDHERQRLVRYNDQTFSLDRMRKLLKLLGNPHEQIKAVQIAGTKGKGSTCAMLSAMMQGCGYTVGLFTSPHLVDLRERICINGDMVSYADFCEACKQIAQVEEQLGEPPTYFEILTAAALLYFAEQAVDIAVLEVGLGGRLDSTTAVDPLVVGVTQISKDHMNLLGDDLPSIAREKAGTFKKDIPAISVEQDAEVAAVFREAAEEAGTTCLFTGADLDFSYRFEANRELGPHTRVCLTTERSRYEHLPVPLKGEHQALNCGLALAILDALKPHGFSFPEDQVIAGLAKTEIHGRMELVHQQPRVMIDGAHNAASIQSLIRALGAHVSYDSLVVIFGCGQDKDVTGMLKQVALGADKVIFTRAKANPRAMEPDDLMSRFSDLSGKMAQKTAKLEDALRLAARAVSREDLIIVTGSFYLAGEARKFFIDAANRQKRRA